MSNTPSARFTFLLDPELKQEFEKVCAAKDITPSQMIRQMIKTHLTEQAEARKDATTLKRVPAKAKK